MTKDSYTYKEILLGLRNEFLEVQRKLDELKDYVIIFDNKNNYYFNLYKNPFDKKLPELTLDRDIQETNRLVVMLRNMSDHRKPIRAFMVKDNNGIYYPLRKYWFKKDDFQMVVMPLEEEKFELLAESILNSDFAKYMTFNGRILAVNADSKPRIVPRSFQFDLLTDKSNISYLGRKDILEFASSRKPNEKWEPLTQDHLDYALGIEFPKEAFSEYHQSIIEMHNYQDKEIVFEDSYKPSIYSKFQINDNGKKIVLSKVRSR